MIREAICEGSDVTVALEKAKAELGLGDTDEFEFDIIQTEEKKKFGLFGGRPAKVRVFIKKTVAQATEEYVMNIIKCMDLNGITVNTTESDNVITIDIEGDDVGFIIGSTTLK